MKIKLPPTVPLLSLLVAGSFQFTPAGAQSTMFTYQGRLNIGINPAGGTYDLRFTLFDAATLGTAQGGALTNAGLVLSNGLFTVPLDFGNQFPGADRWLEIGVRSNGGGSFSTLSPRQKLTPEPYTIFAQHATALANGAAVGSGTGNTVTNGAHFSFIGGGYQNLSGADNGIVGGGQQNANLGPWGFVGGGAGNTNYGSYGVICGGGLNAANGIYAMIGAGYGNLVSGTYSVVPGGLGNTASGDGSFAAGEHAQALHQGAFVWSDSQTGPFASTGQDQFLIRATGGVGIGTAAPVAPLHVRDRNPSGECLVLGVDPHAGGYTALSLGVSAVTNGYAWLQGIKSSGSAYGDLILNPSSGNVGIGISTPATALHVIGTVTATAFNPASDRNLKENFTPVRPREVLDKVAALPISRWNFIGDAATPHVGPMAQDFHAAFGLGTDDRHIATVDGDGVALAAIQGLNQKLEERTQKLESENAELRRELASIKELLDNLATNHNQ